MADAYTRRMRDLPADIKADGGPTHRSPKAPKTRADCKAGPRPCPWVGCKYHLFLDINSRGGLRFGNGEDVSALKAMPDTCVLDVADRGEHDIPYVAARLGTTRQDISRKGLDGIETLRDEIEYWRD